MQCIRDLSNDSVQHVRAALASGTQFTQFTCFAGTKVYILTLRTASDYGYVTTRRQEPHHRAPRAPLSRAPQGMYRLGCQSLKGEETACSHNALWAPRASLSRAPQGI